MGVTKQVTVTCDYPGCTENSGQPLSIQWSETDVERGAAQLPELAKFLVLLNFKQTQMAFCCQLHAAKFFLPPGYEAAQKKVVEFPKPITDSPVNGQGDE
jgi:hypothetical protein